MDSVICRLYARQKNKKYKEKRKKAKNTKIKSTGLYPWRRPLPLRFNCNLEDAPMASGCPKSRAGLDFNLHSRHRWKKENKILKKGEPSSGSGGRAKKRH